MEDVQTAAEIREQVQAFVTERRGQGLLKGVRVAR
jgi:hypothetical protein